MLQVLEDQLQKHVSAQASLLSACSLGRRSYLTAQPSNKLRYPPTVTTVLKIASLPCCSRKGVSRCTYNLQLSVLQSTTCAHLRDDVQQSESIIPQLRLDYLQTQSGKAAQELGLPSYLRIFSSLHIVQNIVNLRISSASSLETSFETFGIFRIEHTHKDALLK